MQIDTLTTQSNQRKYINFKTTKGTIFPFSKTTTDIIFSSFMTPTHSSPYTYNAYDSQAWTEDYTHAAT